MAQSKVFRGTARQIVRKSDETLYCYHKTAVVSVKLNGDIVLNSGGWRTVTTKLAMNQVASQTQHPFAVWQEKGEWFVTWGDAAYEFEDHMLLKADGSVVNVCGVSKQPIKEKANA